MPEEIIPDEDEEEVVKKDIISTGHPEIDKTSEAKPRAEILF